MDLLKELSKARDLEVEFKEDGKSLELSRMYESLYEPIILLAKAYKKINRHYAPNIRVYKREIEDQYVEKYQTKNWRLKLKFKVDGEIKEIKGRIYPRNPEEILRKGIITKPPSCSFLQTEIGTYVLVERYDATSRDYFSYLSSRSTKLFLDRVLKNIYFKEGMIVGGLLSLTSLAKKRINPVYQPLALYYSSLRTGYTTLLIRKFGTIPSEKVSEEVGKPLLKNAVLELLQKFFEYRFLVADFDSTQLILDSKGKAKIIDDELVYVYGPLKRKTNYSIFEELKKLEDGIVKEIIEENGKNFLKIGLKKSLVELIKEDVKRATEKVGKNPKSIFNYLLEELKQISILRLNYTRIN